MTTKKFISVDKNHEININIIDDTAYFSINILNYENYKTFLLLLKSSFEYLIYNNVKYVKQYINEDDIDNFKKSDILRENNLVIVKTKIEDFIIELYDALGMQRL
jgi:hypothetical protein